MMMNEAVTLCSEVVGRLSYSGAAAMGGDIHEAIACVASDALDAGFSGEPLAARCERYEAALRQVGSTADAASRALGRAPVRSTEEWAEPVAV